MTREEIIKTAQEAGFHAAEADTHAERLERFAALVSAKEREALTPRELEPIDRMDAARYRWLRATTKWASSNGERVDVRNNPELWDSAIDACIAKAADVGAAEHAAAAEIGKGMKNA